MRGINSIFVHCSATPPSSDIGVDEIRKWHKKRGWSDVGYHYVIRRDGQVEEGRSIDRKGAHVKGHNNDSIGICLIGGVKENGEADANFTFGQYAALNRLITRLKIENDLGNDDIFGHRDVSSKSCPCFDIHAFLG